MKFHQCVKVFTTHNQVCVYIYGEMVSCTTGSVLSSEWSVVTRTIFKTLITT